MNTNNQNNLSSEVHQDLKDFTETKRSINKLIEHRRAVLLGKKSDVKMDEIKGKILDAIDHLFADK